MFMSRSGNKRSWNWQSSETWNEPARLWSSNSNKATAPTPPQTETETEAAPLATTSIASTVKGKTGHFHHFIPLAGEQAGEQATRFVKGCKLIADDEPPSGISCSRPSERVPDSTVALARRLGTRHTLQCQLCCEKSCSCDADNDVQN